MIKKLIVKRRNFPNSSTQTVMYDQMLYFKINVVTQDQVKTYYSLYQSVQIFFIYDTWMNKSHLKCGFVDVFGTEIFI